MKTSAIQTPLLGFGTYNKFVSQDEMRDAVKTAIESGYRHIDLAKMYENEAEVGAAIRQCIKEGIVTREDLYICNKLHMSDCAPEDVEHAVRASLKATGLDYFDNYMMHFPVQFTKSSRGVSTPPDSDDETKSSDRRESFTIVHQGDCDALLRTYTAMESLVDKKYVRSLGLGHCDVTMFKFILDNCCIRPRTHQFEFHPYLQQHDLLELCEEADVQVVAYCPLGRAALLNNTVIRDIAKSVNRTPAQIVLRWILQQGAAVIPHSTSPEHIASNADILDWTLNKSQLRKIDSIQRNERFLTVPWLDFNMNATPSCHPVLKNQPMVKTGETEADGLYRNSFGRQGRTLHSEIVVKKGIIQELGKYCTQFLPKVSLDAQNFVIVDEICDKALNVDVTFIDAFESAGVRAVKIVVPSSTDESGETSTEPFKNSDVFNSCVQTILENGVSKHSCIVSVGGGVVNNLCGVLAGMIYRGIHLVHFTTTTMGMLDAALDFKQAFNHSLGKNLLGCYYPAETIVIDPDCCRTLSARHIRNGVAEALKHALCQSQELVNKIVDPVHRGGDDVLSDGTYIEDICKESIEIKAPTLDHYAESDFNEMCPQYGHAVGHAVEALSWTHSHEPLLHGEAVAIGMCVSAEIARMRGLCDQETVEQHYEAVQNMGLPAHIPATMTTDMVLKKMTFDKHYVKQPSMGLVAKIGVMAYDRANETFSFSISNDELTNAMEANMQRAMYVCQPC